MIGMINKVINVENKSPEPMAIAIGENNSSLAAINGIRPSMVVTVVNRIGLIRLVVPEIVASSIYIHSFIRLLMLSTNRIALLTTIPIKLTIPIKAVKDIGKPLKYNPNKAPEAANGIDSNMMKVCLNELNWMSRIKNTRNPAKTA